MRTHKNKAHILKRLKDGNKTVCLYSLDHIGYIFNAMIDLNRLYYNNILQTKFFLSRI
jgi:hypothetical protein